jgi:hypothetical protein
MYVCLAFCSLEETSEGTSKKETNGGADTQEDTHRLTEVCVASVEEW